MPPDDVTIEVPSSDADAVAAAVSDGLMRANVAAWPEARSEPVVLAARVDGALVGGLTGRVAWAWLRIDRLWVDAAHRGRGIAGRLVQEAEQHARGAGAVGAFVDTFSFQAPDFYLRHGYRVLAALEAFPPGAAHLFLWKPFEARARARAGAVTSAAAADAVPGASGRDAAPGASGHAAAPRDAAEMRGRKVRDDDA